MHPSSAFPRAPWGDETARVSGSGVRSLGAGQVGWQCPRHLLSLFSGQWALVTEVRVEPAIGGHMRGEALGWER